MKKISNKKIKDFIEANYVREKEKIDEIGIESFNDYIVDDVLGPSSFENEIEEFYNTLAICVIMKKLNLRDEYFFEVIDELMGIYKDGNYDKYITEKELIDKDLLFIIE